jgi:hypothetical protein
VKQYTTKVLKSLAALFLGFPLLYLIWVATVFDMPLNTCIGILLSPFFYIVSISVMVAGYGLWEMRRWSWHVFLLSQVLVFYENALFILHYSESHHKALAFFLSSFLQVGLIYRLAKEIRVPYFFPKIRWWESNPRYKLSVPVTVIRKEGSMQEGEILDLSVLGCFIKLRPDLLQDESISLQFSLFGYDMKCEGRVVWTTQSAVTHPKGVGVKFGLLSKSNRRSLRAISRRLKKIAVLYRRSRYLMSQEEFLRQLEELESAGFGTPPQASTVTYKNS